MTKERQMSSMPMLLGGWAGTGTVVERRSVTSELPLSYARPAADG